MAYREFHEEPIYADPGVDILNQGLQNAAQNISSFFNSIGQREKDKQRAAASYQYALDKGSYESDQELLGQYALNVKDRAVQDIRKTGRISPEVQQMQAEGLTLQQKSKIQFERAKQVYDRINQKAIRDKYYSPEEDLKKLDKAADYDTNLYTRGDIIDDADKNLGSSDATFKYNNYRADYVKGLGDQYKQTEYGNDKVKKTNYDQATFWDTKTGKPGVTDEHAIDYIKSEPRVDQYFNRRVDEQLNREVEAMKASADPKVAWMDGLTQAEIKNELINDPTKNLINQQDFGVRKRELAKQDLQKADRINSKVSVDYNADKKENTGPIKNENIVHSYAFNDGGIVASTDGGKPAPIGVSGAGGVLFQKNGKPIQFSSSNPVRTNINTGLTNRNKIGSVPFNLTSYQLQPFQVTGSPFILPGKTFDEQLNSIKTLPLEYFSPTGKYKLKPQLGVALNGYTINKANILNAANNEVQNLSTQISKAESAQDIQKAAALQMKLDQIQGLKQIVGTGIDDQELMLAASRAGINGVQINEMVEANDTDMANLNAITGGFNLRDKTNWSPEMKALDQAYSQRAAEAAQKGYKSPEAAKTTKSNKKAKFPLPAGQPRSRNQNGYIYTWNEDTGKYQ